MNRTLLSVAAIATCAGAFEASAVPYNYVDWTSANPQGGTASGVITLPDASTVNVNFNVFTATGAPGSFFFGQTNGGTNYWNPSTPYISAEVDNAPPDPDILALIGGVNHTYVVSLSEPIKDPIMAIVSLGRGGSNTSYVFDRPFDIVSEGAGFWGGNDTTALEELPGNVLLGNEGHGTIQFLGTFDTFAWTVPTGENWHGFTYGIRTTLAIEPDPDPDAVPEPATLGLVGAALAGICGVRRRRRARG
ncbi:MAG: PEP-CTERM sorting domain-containing protein [Gammaproteobacteria bacterium]